MVLEDHEYRTLNLQMKFDRLELKCKDLGRENEKLKEKIVVLRNKLEAARLYNIK